MTTDRASPPCFERRFQEEFELLLRWRRDVRRFRRDPLPEGALARLVSLASLSPSVGLSEPWRFVSVADPVRRAAVRASHRGCNDAARDGYVDERAALYASLKLAGLDDAPCQLAVFSVADPAQGHRLGRATMPETADWSAVIAVHTLWLAARAHGLGVGWVSILDPDAVARALDVPADWRLVAYLCIGVPEEESDAPALERAGWEHRRGASSGILER